MIQRVYRQVQKATCFQEIVVATDDARIFDHVLAFGGKAVMTLSTHRSGTDRCAEVLDKMPTKPAVVVNIQGDATKVRKVLNWSPEYDLQALVNDMCKTDWELAQRT